MTTSGHNFAHAMTAELLWHVQNYDLILSYFFKSYQYIFFMKFGLGAHKPIAKWVQGFANKPSLNQFLIVLVAML